MTDNEDDKEVLDMETSKNTWKFTVNTASNDNTTGVPLSPDSIYTGCEDDYGDYVHLPGDPYVVIDWGDGERDTVDEQSNAWNCMHKYTDGKDEHQITLSAEPWVWETSICLTMPEMNYDRYDPRLEWEKTLVSVDSPVPMVKGMVRPGSSDVDLVNMYWLDERLSTQPIPVLGHDYVNDYVNDCDSNSLSQIGSERSCCWYCRNSLESLFEYCDHLENIPGNIFHNNPDVTDVSYAFYGCKSLGNIPDTLFSKNTYATDFNFTFCAGGFKDVPENLFSGNPLAQNFCGTFRNSRLREIPPKIFHSNRVAEKFSYVFYGTPIQKIPPQLFNSNQYARNVDNAFGCCDRLTVIPNGLLKRQKFATDCYCMFGDCNALNTLPDYIFSHTAAKEKAFRKMAFDRDLLKRLDKGMER